MHIVYEAQCTTGKYRFFANNVDTKGIEVLMRGFQPMYSGGLRQAAKNQKGRLHKSQSQSFAPTGSAGIGLEPWSGGGWERLRRYGLHLYSTLMVRFLPRSVPLIPNHRFIFIHILKVGVREDAGTVLWA